MYIVLSLKVTTQHSSIQLLDLPLLTEIILNNNALRGHCDSSRRLSDSAPYYYLNELVMKSENQTCYLRYRYTKYKLPKRF